MLLLQASWSRHKTWGLLGAMDDKDVQKIKSLVKDLRYVSIRSTHAIHLGEAKLYLDQVNNFVELFAGAKSLLIENRLFQ